MITKAPAGWTPPAVYSYSRFSAKTQRKGTGKRRQDGLAVAYCSELGWSLTKNYDDLGVSAHHGRNATHGELAAFLKLVREGRIRVGSVLLVESLDRLSRDNINKALELFLSIINAGVVVITLCDRAIYRADTDPHTLMAQMMISLAIFVRANDESRMKSSRKAASWAYKREAAATGAYHGGKLPVWIKLDAGRYTVIESKANPVRTFFEQYNKGVGLYILSRQLNIPKATLAYWLDSRITLGTLTVTDEGRQVHYANHYPAIISRDAWELAQVKRRDRKVGQRRGGPEFINLFQGLLTYRGQSLIVQQPNGKRADRLYVADGICIRLSALEEHLTQNHLYNSLVEKRIVKETSETDQRELAKLDAKIAEIQAAMQAEPSLFSDLLPVLRDVKKRRSELTKSDQVVLEKVDRTAIENAISGFADDGNDAARLRLRDMIRDTVESITVVNVEGQYRRLVTARMVMTDGSSRDVRFAYDSRRLGVVSCDGTGIDPRKMKWLDQTQSTVLTIPLNTTKLNDAVMAELDKLPIRPKAVPQVARKSAA